MIAIESVYAGGESVDWCVCLFTVLNDVQPGFSLTRCIGRAIRHANDYATILLLDKRFATMRIRNKLPKWIGEDIKVQEDYGGAARAVATFFKHKRERGLG